MSALAMATRRSSRSTPKVQRLFLAEWEDFKKLEAEAIRLGWDPNSGDGFLDTCHPSDYPACTDSKTFADLRSAVSFVRDVVRKRLTVFGVADVFEVEITPLGERCRYCTCRGQKVVQRYAVTDDGIEEKEAVDDCAN